MQAELKINKRGDKNDLMVIERAGGTVATSNAANSERGEHTSALLISSLFFFFYTAHFFYIFTATSQVRFIWNDSEQQRPAKALLRDKEGIHGSSDSCAN